VGLGEALNEAMEAEASQVIGHAAGREVRQAQSEQRGQALAQFRCKSLEHGLSALFPFGVRDGHRLFPGCLVSALMNMIQKNEPGCPAGVAIGETPR